jgi:hypothetical protein
MIPQENKGQIKSSGKFSNRQVSVLFLEDINGNLTQLWIILHDN